MNHTRRNWMATAAGTAALASGFSSTGFAQGSPERGIVGQPAPELAVDDWTGANGEATEFSVTASRGKWVFLKCFQSWCPGCHSSGFPTLQAVQEAFHGHPEVAIAAVQTVFEGFGTNTREQIPVLRERYALDVPMGHDAGDPDGDHMPQTMRDYRTGGTPWLVLIDPEGRVAFDGFHVFNEKLIEFLEKQIA